MDLFLQGSSPASWTAQTSTPAPSSYAFDMESITLMKLRKAERERLERELREQEEQEG